MALESSHDLFAVVSEGGALGGVGLGPALVDETSVGDAPWGGVGLAAAAAV